MAKMVEILHEPDWKDAEINKQLDRVDSIFRNGGFDPSSGETMQMADAMDIPNAAFLIPRVLTTFLQEGIEPMLIGTSLLPKIQYVPGMQTVFPALDVLTAREAADGGALPIFNINVGGGMTFGVTVKRHGLALRVAERFIEQSTYPWLQYWLKLAGNALARHKEEYIFSYILGLGTVVFDNSVAGRSYGAVPQPIKGITTGRNHLGEFNGSIVADDIYDMYAQVLMQGFIPDTVLVHPMAWLMMIKDPVLREFAIQAGGGSFFAQFTGNAAAQAFPFFNFRGLGPGVGQTGQYNAGVLSTASQTGTVQGLPQNQTSAFMLPNYLGLPFRILVSPFLPYDPVNKLTSIILFNSSNLGALIVDEEPHVNSWNEPQYNIRNIGIEESYGFGILNEGQAIAVAKNVAIKPNQIVLPARTVIDLASSNTFQNLETTINFQVGSTGGTAPENVLGN